jgi:hypothetical protein
MTYGGRRWHVRRRLGVLDIGGHYDRLKVTAKGGKSTRVVVCEVMKT